MKESLESEICAWESNDDGVYETSCGEAFVLNDGTPFDNKMMFCCYCGKSIVETNGDGS